MENQEIEIRKLREGLRRYMAEKDMTLTQVARKIGRHIRTVWVFLNEKNGGHNFQTLYRIRDLIERDQQKREAKERRTE